MLTPAQCRAARALLNWSQQQLANASLVGNATIRNFESEKSEPTHSTLAALRRALESANIEFTNGKSPGAKMKPSKFAITSANFKEALTNLETDGLARFGTSAKLEFENEYSVRLMFEGQEIGSAAQGGGSAYFKPEPDSEGGIIPRSGAVAALAGWAKCALQSAGVVFVEENGEGPGVRLRKVVSRPPRKKDP
jgi:transcriptional regulator with XRE-family HTH domain